MSKKSLMAEALNAMLENEYSGVVINADGFEYLALLKVMRSLTYAPIGVAVTHYNKDEHDAAVDNGADIYRVRYDHHVYRVRGFSNVVKIYLEFNKWQKEKPPPIVHNDIRILQDTRRVFVKGSELVLGRIEFDILCYLIKNKGRILTHEQILSNVWGEDYADSSREALWWNMSMLRKKLRTEANLPNLIKTKYGVGYSVN